eukprot:TRINITY_DN3529_c0_g3_i1.p1 TRINITY_DN3529_c0_g3~~TRINITY_DN3529_c0_g3_i1.p1  ORF type:complete len:401 (-),score=128.82 TRINITY_DN3529_c0_g3_i1:89-1111(-)
MEQSHWEESKIFSVLKESRNKYLPSSAEYQLVLITDLDRNSKKDTYSWYAVLKYGKLTRKEREMDNSSSSSSSSSNASLLDQNLFDITWEDREVHLHSKFNHGGRGMELSELVLWNGKLITCDDQSGLVGEIVRDQLIPIHILMEGDGQTSKGHKCEWLTVKGNVLFLGSTGKEWTEAGKVINQNPMWIKKMEVNGRVSHHDWSHVYHKLRKELDMQYPGYVLHEAVSWNEKQKRWYFLPRKMSKEGYDEQLDEKRGSNLLLSLDENFSDFQMQEIGPFHMTHGFSSFKFLPFRDEIVGIKTEEVGERVATYIVVFDIHGKILMEEKLISNQKFEGIEII